MSIQQTTPSVFESPEYFVPERVVGGLEASVESADSAYSGDGDSDMNVDLGTSDGCQNRDDDDDDRNSPGALPPQKSAFNFEERRPPTTEAAKAALQVIRDIIRPPRDTGDGYKDPKIDRFTLERLEEIRTFLSHYTSSASPNYGAWISASMTTATGVGKGSWHARQLRMWAKSFVLDHSCLPENPYGGWNVSWLEENDLAEEILLHLQYIGKYVRAQDLVEYLDRPEVKARLRMKKTISLATAQRWMKDVGFRWTKNGHKGQYVDGHEREDVVYYRQNVFLPKWAKLQERTRKWKDDHTEEMGPLPQNRRIVVWFHDESTFYANDRRRAQWVHKDATPTPQAKGEGASLMIADFVSADYGWLQSPDGKESARVEFRAGKTREGYFNSTEIIDQAERAMDILTRHFPDEEHVLVFDNATTHLKRADGALSARSMPKGPSKGLESNWGVTVTARGDSGQAIHDENGRPKKIKVPMGDGELPDGSPQSFYFPEGHPRAGIFKGMVQILEERGFQGMASLKAECKSFQCKPGATNCCCRRILFNQPDFANVKSMLETACEERGFEVLFLPKFHCELNFIEQVWGHAKRVYRLNPPSSKEADLERNVRAALDSVDLIQMQKYVLYFTDGSSG